MYRGRLGLYQDIKDLVWGLCKYIHSCYCSKSGGFCAGKEQDPVASRQKQNEHLENWLVSSGWNEVHEISRAEEEGYCNNGDCRILRNCPPLLYILLRGKTRPEVLERLNQRRCGFEGKEPMVCCPRFYPSTVDSKLNRLLSSTEYPNLEPRPNEDVFLSVSCGNVGINDKIVGGRETDLYEYPWMVLIGYGTGQGVEYRCGGTLISRRFILTAAHCVTNLKGLAVQSVRLGEHDTSTNKDCRWEDCAEPAMDIPVKRVIPHPDFDTKTFTNDIALIELAEDVKFSKSVQPICLPVEAGQRKRVLDGETAVISGWGATELRGSSPVLRFANVRVLSQEACSHMYRKIVPISESQICAIGGMGQDSCSGDSGGPLKVLIRNWKNEFVFVQYGVVSFGPRICGNSRIPGVYTRVTAYLDWIERIIR